MTSLLLAVLVAAFTHQSLGESMETVLAASNYGGMGEALLLKALGGRDLSKDEIFRKVSTREGRHALTMAAINFISSKVSKSEARGFMNDATDSGLCTYSWIAWLPFSGCAANLEPSTREETHIPSLPGENVCYVQ